MALKPSWGKSPVPFLRSRAGIVLSCGSSSFHPRSDFGDVGILFFPLSFSLAGKGIFGDAEAIKIARALEKNTSLTYLR